MILQGEKDGNDDTGCDSPSTHPGCSRASGGPPGGDGGLGEDTAPSNDSSCQGENGRQGIMSMTREDLQLAFEADILRHFAYVQAGTVGAPQGTRAAVGVPGSMGDLKELLRKQGFKLDADDPWSVLGMGPLCGPEPCALDISSRARIAVLLLTLAEGPSYSDADRRLAARWQTAIQNAATRCAQGIEDMGRERRRFHKEQLPRWKELGTDAMAMVRACPHTGDAVFLTQWSCLLDPQGLGRERYAECRRLADLMKQGDPKLWVEVAGPKLVAWAPTDHSTLGRLLRQFESHPTDSIPKELFLAAPLPVFKGVTTAAQYLDL